MKFLTLLTVLKEEFFQTLKYRFQNISLWDDRYTKMMDLWEDSGEKIDSQLLSRYRGKMKRNYRKYRH